jgi:hypothetical protein
MILGVQWKSILGQSLWSVVYSKLVQPLLGRKVDSKVLVPDPLFNHIFLLHQLILNFCNTLVGIFTIKIYKTHFVISLRIKFHNIKVVGVECI